jgi:hypothetical protein
LEYTKHAAKQGFYFTGIVYNSAMLQFNFIDNLENTTMTRGTFQP